MGGGDTPSPTPSSESYFVKQDDNGDYFVVNNSGLWVFYQNLSTQPQQQYLKCSGPGTDVTPVTSAPIGGSTNPGPMTSKMGFETFTSGDVTFTWDNPKFVASLRLAEFEG